MNNLKTILTAVFMVPFWVVSTPSFSQIDPTTGLPIAEHEDMRLSPITRSEGPGRILWDTSHGVFANYRPGYVYSGWTSLMEALGREVIDDSNGISNLNLHEYDVLVINCASSIHFPYTSAEVDQIAEFVFDGGSLIVLADNAGSWPANINPICTRFGTTTGLSIIEPYDLYIDDFVNHPVFHNVNQIYFRAAGGISMVPPSNVLAWTDEGEAIISYAYHGAGKVIITGDINFMDNTYIQEGDNQLFSENIFNWLLQPRVMVPTLSSFGIVLFAVLLGIFSVIIIYSAKTKTSAAVSRIGK